jgi:hypothetical protein
MADASGMIRERHVIPCEDLREHDLTSDCWCRPFEDGEMPGLWAHNSMDRRELLEEAKGMVQ